jgi:hypothetical protein
MYPANKKQCKRQVKVMLPTIGKDLQHVLGQTLVRDWYAAISEFVCNSYDADAENVQINIDPNRQTLEMIDDGSGMDNNGLESFLRMGDSVKLKEPISPLKHRKRLGKKGIAKTLLRFLGDSAGIETVNRGNKYVIDEVITSDQFVPAQVFPVSSKTQIGTTILVRGLHFNVRENFDVEGLYQRLQWDAPNKQDFDVFVNGRLVKKRRLIEYAPTYQVEEDIGGGNRITGRIYLQKDFNKGRLDGVFVCVNGRAVGGSSLIDLNSIDSRLVDHVQGEINADFLETLITLDRAGFKEDPKVDKVVKAINKVLQSVSYDLDQGKQRREYYAASRVSPIIEDALVDAQLQLNLRLSADYELVLSNRSEAGSIARLDSSSKRIYLNVASKMFSFIKTKEKRNRNMSEIYLKRAFLIAAAHAIAKQSNNIGEEISDLTSSQIDSAFKGASGISEGSGDILGTKVTPQLDDVYLNQFRLYDHYEVGSMTGRSAFVVRLLHSSGALQGTEDHLFSRKNILNAFKPIERKVSCIEVVDLRYAPKSSHKNANLKILYDHPKPTSLDSSLANIQLDGLGLINVGIAHPLFFVPMENTEKFRDLVRERKLYN